MQYEDAFCSVMMRTKKPCGERAVAFYDVTPPQLRRSKQKTRRNYLCSGHLHLASLLGSEAVYWMNGKLLQSERGS